MHFLRNQSHLWQPHPSRAPWPHVLGSGELAHYLLVSYISDGATGGSRSPVMAATKAYYAPVGAENPAVVMWVIRSCPALGHHPPTRTAQ